MKPDEKQGMLQYWPEIFFGVKPYPWQFEVLQHINKKHSQTLLQTNNESGKTSLIGATAVLWHMAKFEGSVALCTAGVYRQVHDQMWPVIRERTEKLGGSAAGWVVKEDEVSFHGSHCYGFSTDQGNKFEGFHRRGASANLMIVIDEAKTVPDSIFQAVERCRPTRTLVMSTPGERHGEFFKMCDKPPMGWKYWKVTAADCPHIEKHWINQQIDRWGIEHPLVKSMIFAEFMEVGRFRPVVAWDKVNFSMENPPTRAPGKKLGHCDFAAEGDENVFGFMDGNEIFPLVGWREKDPMHNAARFITEFKKCGLKPDEIAGDSAGMGHPMCGILDSMGWPIHRSNAGEKAYEDDVFSNRGTEIWVKAAREVEKNMVVLPKDDILKEQMSNRMLLTDSRGRLKLEPKETLRARGKDSPDRADVVFGLIERSEICRKVVQQKSPLWEMWDEVETDTGNHGYPKGAFAGV